VLIHGVDECERWDRDGQHDQGGDDCPNHFQGGVVRELLGLQLPRIVELGCNLSSGKIAGGVVLYESDWHMRMIGM